MSIESVVCRAVVGRAVVVSCDVPVVAELGLVAEVVASPAPSEEQAPANITKAASAAIRLVICEA